MLQTTLLTVAHRLQTVLDYDRIVCMECGKCIEVGNPHELLLRPEAALSLIVDSLGPRTADRLRAIARKAAKHSWSEQKAECDLARV